ncbi:MAG TPA: glycoside hydrolase family 16 protein [Paludibacter sp.]
MKKIISLVLLLIVFAFVLEAQTKSDTVCAKGLIHLSNSVGTHCLKPSPTEIDRCLGMNEALQYCTHKTTSSGKWNLVWDDEFDYIGLPDPVKWSFETAGNKTGWGNNEDQHYTDKDSTNAWVSNGVLTITARKVKMGRKKYTSARLNSQGKGDWLYGRFEVRAKLPTGRGTWPAIWMLSTDWAYGGWPESGELDIMENVGFMPDTLVFSAHTKAYNHIMHTQKTKRILYYGTSDAYHVYAMEWEKEQIRFYVDDYLTLTVNNEHKTFAEWPFDRPFHLILNLAIGGFWGGEKGIDNSIFPCRFDIDYVRVYQSDI